MPDRSEVLGIVFLAVPVALVFILNAGAKSFVHANLGILIFLGTFPIFVYGIYWAFSTRSALAVRVYRNQALATGVLGLTLWLSIVTIVLASNSSVPQISDGVTAIAFAALLLGFFYFTDVTMKAARRSDPLLRDTLNWSRVRIPLWALVIIPLGSVMVVAAYASITDDAFLLNGLNTGDFGNVVFNFVFNWFVYISFVGVITIPLVAYRAKWDRAFRRYLVWLGVAVVILFVDFFFTIPGAFLQLFLIGGYFLFRAAKSLAPTSRISKSEGPLDLGPPLESPTAPERSGDTASTD
jgi:hypothetical protein